MRPTRQPLSLLYPLAIVTLFALACAPSGRYSSPSSAGAGSEPPLELLSYRGTREYSFLIVEGQVRNKSSQKLEGIMAVVETYDSTGQLVTSQDSMIEYLPLMPGQTSPFKVMIRDNPAIQNFKVGFKEILGGLVPYTDLSPQKQPAPSKKKK